MTRRTANRKRRGFTWIEVLVAVFIISLSAITLVALFPMSAKTQNMVGDYNQASSLIQHKIDQMRAVGYGRCNYTELKNAGIIDATPTNSPFSFYTVDTLDDMFPNATGTVTVADNTSADSRVSEKQVTVTITWSGSSMRQGNGTLSTTTLIAKG